MNYIIFIILILLTISGFIRAHNFGTLQDFKFLTLFSCFIFGTLIYWGELWLTSFSKNPGPDSLTIIGFLGIILCFGAIVCLILSLVIQRYTFSNFWGLAFNNKIGFVILLFDSVLVLCLNGTLPFIYWIIPIISAILGIILIIKK